MPLKVMGSAKKTYCKNLNKRLGRSLNSLSKFFYLGAYSTFRKLRNNYFLDACLWSKQVTFALYL